MSGSRLTAILRQRCPDCCRGRVFSGSFRMNEFCPRCGVKFEREPGYFFGAMYISYALSVPIIAGLTVLLWLTFPSSWELEWVVCLAGGLFLPLVPMIFRYSRILWMHVDRYVDPDSPERREGMGRGTRAPASEQGSSPGRFRHYALLPSQAAEVESWEKTPVSAFNVQDFRQALQTRVIGRHLHYLPVVSSTNTTARELGRQGAPEGTVVVADAQTAGRGQAGKVWISPPERNLYVSVLLRPSLPPSQAPLISLLAAVALVDVLRQEGAAGGIKWPNDVLLQGRKVGGILTEMETDGHAVRFVVVGIGVNVNMTQAELNCALGPIASTATSVRAALGREVCREALLASLLQSLERWDDRWRLEGSGALVDAWQERSCMHDRRIVARTSETTWEGIAVGIDQAGCLLLRQDDGSMLALTSAEIQFVS